MTIGERQVFLTAPGGDHLPLGGKMKPSVGGDDENPEPLQQPTFRQQEKGNKS